MKWQNQLEVYRGHCQSTRTTEEIHILNIIATTAQALVERKELDMYSHGAMDGKVATL